MVGRRGKLRADIDFLPFSCYVYTMTIEQTIEVPADYRIFLELPRSVPSGVKARIEINIPAESANEQSGSLSLHPVEINEIRQLLQKEMAEQKTQAIIASSGDGWESHIRERYAES